MEISNPLFIPDGSITASKIAALSIGSTELANGSIYGYKLVLGTLDTSRLAADAGILGTQLAAAADILGSQLAASADIIGTQLASAAGITDAQLATAHALLAGDSSQVFDVATGTSTTEATNVGQSFVQSGASVNVNLQSSYVAATSYTNTGNNAQFHYLSLSGSTTFTVDFEFYLNGAWITVASATFDSGYVDTAAIAIVVPPGITWQVSALPTAWTTIQ